MRQLLFVFSAIVLLSLSCKQVSDDNKNSNNLQDSLRVQNNEDSLLKIDKQRFRDSILLGHDSSWVDLSVLLPFAKFDIRYADTSNFMKTKVYDCPACYTRLIVAKSLMSADKTLDSLGLGFIFYDCYRPSSAQFKLWEKKPDARYVLPPSYGSKHSRGYAIDLGLYELKSGKILDMGSDFDYFGPEASLSYKGHSSDIYKNRNVLLKTMIENNFSFYNMEWWHFEFKTSKFELSDFKWHCK